MDCPQCGGTDSTQIELHLTDDQSVQFFSCRRCEARWWQREGDSIALDEVLTIAANKSKSV